MKVNIKTVALRADVSTATVSRVLTGSSNVKEKTRIRVLEVMTELNYELNAVARSLRQRKTYSIGIIIGNVLSEFYSIIAKSVEDVATSFGYNMILCNSDFNADKELNYLKVLKSNRVDGIILYPTGENIEYIQALIDSGTKMVLLDGLINGISCDAVLADNENGSYEAMKFLIEQGYKNVGIINGNIKSTTGRDRLNGCRKALNESGLPVSDELIKIGSFKKASGIKLAEELITKENRPEAIFAGNLDMTMGAIIAIKEAGLKVPDDIGIVGFDDSDWAKIIEPPLTTVSQPVYEMGKTAANLLIEKINNNDGKDRTARLVILATKLIIRNSTMKKT